MNPAHSCRRCRGPIDCADEDMSHGDVVCAGCLTSSEDEAETRAFCDILSHSAARATSPAEAAILYGYAFLALDNLNARRATVQPGFSASSHGSPRASRH